MTLTPTEQQKIDQAIKDYELRCKMYGSPSASSADHFQAGCEYFAGELMAGRMQEVLLWVAQNFINEGEFPSPWRKFGMNEYFSCGELVNLFFTQEKQKENEQGNKV